MLINLIRSSWLLGATAVFGFVSIQAKETVPQDAPLVINDSELVKDLANKLGEMLLKQEGVSSDDLKSQFARTTTKLALMKKKQGVMDDLYRSSVNSVGVISSAYKCEKCPHWHLNGVATCWALTDDGVMVSNYHVFNNKDVTGFGIQTRDGYMAPVLEILATDKENDICIFRVAKKEGGYEPLALGKAQKVGGNAHIIAHPDQRYYTYTAGKVSRYYKNRSKRDNYFMGVTAEFARGSSGGPVMDDEGNVIGMVVSTNPIYYPSKDPKKNPRGNFQMTIRNCVPVDAIRNLVIDSSK